MGFLRRVAGFLGFGKDESVEANDELNDDGDVNRVDPNLPRKGFSVSVKVAANRAQVRPLLVPCDSGDGGVQVISPFFDIQYFVQFYEPFCYYLLIFSIDRLSFGAFKCISLARTLLKIFQIIN